MTNVIINQLGNHILKRHIECVHGSVTYPFDQCDYKETQKLSLKQHIESDHENITYPCDQCDLKATLS